MKNTFTGTVLQFPNRGIHYMLAEVMTLRKQCVLRDEFKSLTGWNDSLNEYLQTGLEKIAATVKRVCYSPSGVDPVEVRAQRIAQAKDTTTGLKEVFDGKSINSDDIVMPNLPLTKEVSYDLTGVDPDYPQPTPDRIPNDTARAFVVGLDYLVVMATNLDSRTQPATISAFECAQLLAMLNELYALTELKGGEKNKSDAPTGVPMSVRPSTFNADGQYDPKAVPVAPAS